ncbi:MAG: hypothetical protein UT32_C0005G0027 [Parcubacteria group bacterium GW2011_GWC2_39_14]|nr:MAG: hypothetical protein UT32_C0005G0027 [Parcubacteria group bacterium GW2011_GWC2_39_14]KKR54608.1 MAG: hypothetical protein UT91_C0012G0027 [Parcubacteria group bacterium GW2011_GWA2_40_23]
MGNEMIIRKIKNRFKIIENEISQLVDDKYVFEQYKKYIEDNKNISKQNNFLFWIAKNYQILSVINVCKQVDERNDVESLVNLLKDFKKLKNSFSLGWFVQKYPVWMRGNGENDFKKFTIKNNKKISVKKIDNDIKEIKQAICGVRFGKKRQSVESLKKYRNKRGAHFSNDNKKAIVPIKKLFNAIDLLEKMTIKYNLLLNQADMDTLLSANIDEYIEFDKVFKK